MRNETPTLHLVCGKIAAGKSTLAERLASQSATILISLDTWLSGLYPGEITSLPDFVSRSECLRKLMEGHVSALLQAGLSVVLDFPANTPELRQWARRIFEAAGAAHQLHYLDMSDPLCKARLKLRNESGTHEFAASEADFDLITSYFVPPSADENFNVKIHSQA